MKEYFKSNENERKLIVKKINDLSLKLDKTKTQLPDAIPDYLQPSFAQKHKKIQKI